MRAEAGARERLPARRCGAVRFASTAQTGCCCCATGQCDVTVDWSMQALPLQRIPSDAQMRTWAVAASRSPSHLHARL